MAKAIALIASALCVLALAGIAQSHDEFVVTGKVYCDTCRVLFETKLSINLSGAEVELYCRNRENGTMTLSTKALTGEDGTYKITVSGDHADDICEVSVVNSNNPACSDVAPEIAFVRVALAENCGVQSNVRYANPIGFLLEDAMPHCHVALDELGFVPLD